MKQRERKAQSAGLVASPSGEIEIEITATEPRSYTGHSMLCPYGNRRAYGAFHLPLFQAG